MSRSYQAFCWMTAQADQAEHAVTDDAQASGMAARSGRYTPVCGQGFLAACMDMAPASRCSCCAWLVQERADLRAFYERLTAYRQPGWLDRMLCRYEDPADSGETTPPIRIASAGAHPREGRHAA